VRSCSNKREDKKTGWMVRKERRGERNNSRRRSSGGQLTWTSRPGPNPNGCSCTRKKPAPNLFDEENRRVKPL
jgi:hypothetical protein